MVNFYPFLCFAHTFMFYASDKLQAIVKSLKIIHNICVGRIAILVYSTVWRFRAATVRVCAGYRVIY